MNKSNLKNNYAAPIASTVLLKTQRILCQSGVKTLQDLSEDSLFDENFN